MKIWVVEQNMGHGRWEPMVCEGEIVAHVNYYGAHRLKRDIVETWWDLESKRDERENFRVREYAPKK